MSLPSSIYIAIEMMRKSFGGTDIELISHDLHRLAPDEFSVGGKIGVYIAMSGVRVYFGVLNAEDIIIYGQKAADNFVFNILKPEYERIIRKKKIKEIHPDIK